MEETVNRINAMFYLLNRRSSSIGTIPPPGSLAAQLSKLVENVSGDVSQIDSFTASLFITASVEMWHRSIHSFLISASLTMASPLWASVSGYYSSHYSVRAFAHLLGYFQLMKKKKILQVQLNQKQYICRIIDKHASDREHKFYWKAVKNHKKFVNDPFFTTNEEGQPRSDSGHRSKGNYLDHINKFPQFQVLDESILRDRVERIASLELSDAPIPRIDSYPDIDNVQVIAYHRMVAFRKFVDEIVGSKNRFWNIHREPSWCRTFVDYQIIEPRYTALYGDLSI